MSGVVGASGVVWLLGLLVLLRLGFSSGIVPFLLKCLCLDL